MAPISAHLWIEGRDFRSDVSTWIDVPPELAFAYVADMPRHREWAVHEIEVRRVEPGDTRLGSRFESRGKQGNRWWPSHLEVIKYEPPRLFGFTATGGPLGTEEGRLHSHQFVFDSKDVGTAFELRRVDPILSRGLRFRAIRLIAPIFNAYVRGIRIRTVENLGRRLEALPKAGV